MDRRPQHPADNWKWQTQSRLRGLTRRRRSRAHSTRTHSHERWQWLGVLRGRLEVHLDAAALQLEANHFVLVPPGSPRRFAHPAGAIDYVFAYLDCEGLAVGDVAGRPVPVPSRLRPLLVAVATECDEPRCENARALCEAHILRLLIECRRRERRRQHADPLPGPHQTLMGRIDTHLKNNLDRPLSRPDLARLMGLSESQLARIVKQETGTTLSQRLTRYRLRAAERLLLDTDLSIAHIALEVGFASFEPFSRLFRRHHGVAPSTWRRRMRG